MTHHQPTVFPDRRAVARPAANVVNTEEILSDPRKLKVYSDRRSFMSAGQRHAQALFPFWGVVQKPTAGIQSSRFDVWAQEGQQWFTMTSLEDCDVAIVPAEVGDWSSMKEGSLRFISHAAAANKPAALFFFSDSQEPLNVDNCHVFRTSLDDRTRQACEYALPAWSEDFVKEYWNGELPLRQKGEVPVVGFCGQPGPLDLSQRIKLVPRFIVNSMISLIGPHAHKQRLRQRRVEEGDYPGLDPSYIRVAAIRALARNPRVKTNFLFKRGYFNITTIESQQLVRQDLLTNTMNSDYVLCARGQGNFSYRLYETLCSGRIPVLVNTHCVLPFEDKLDWKSFSVWVEADDVGNIGHKVAEFHAALSPEAFMALQKRCREVWEEWISPEGFFLKFSQHFFELNSRGET